MLHYTAFCVVLEIHFYSKEILVSHLFYLTSVLQLLVSELIQRFLNSYLESDLLSGKNESFCNICFPNNQALADQEISKVSDYLIIQMKRFLVFNQAVTKDISKISCTPTLSVPVTLMEDIVGHKKFMLIATINHSGNLEREHSTSFIKSTSSSWFHCNDAAVIPSKETVLNNDTSYIFFFKNVSWEYEKKRETRVMCKGVLITSGALHPCPLLSSWYFSYMRFSITFQGNKPPLMTILDLFRGSPACFPGQQLVWWNRPKLLLS